MAYAVIGRRERELAAALWAHLVIDAPLRPAGAIVALGSHDTRVAERAARVFLDGLAPLLVLTGGRGKVTEDWPETEARVFARVAAGLGVPESAMVLEETARNTGENITATRRLLGGRIRGGILVAKPYMTRRGLATARRQWPEAEWQATGPPMGFAEYLDGSADPRAAIELMVGDLQRMRVYADRGFQVPDPVPDEVWDAHLELAARGFDRHVIREEG
ncbi:YdcF family protein [Actinomadura parmotrematis]|uniref:YdcF family protein n=1 Tax=Actinomadura parmotrematis TaxID=2864039 RepID=A0ABS7FZK6_9ACTN|nr:YdcF family protein [Actinomadura parmotrematis]MBW8485575.1 YdcF family protein [Actinomadura parmotrematis]